jgi:hypothetical protein
MEHSPSWEANSRSARHEIPAWFNGTERSLPYSKQPPVLTIIFYKSSIAVVDNKIVENKSMSNYEAVVAVIGSYSLICKHCCVLLYIMW